MLRTTFATSLAAATLLLGATVASAQTGPVITGGGDNLTITYEGGADRPVGNIVGGGVAIVSGGGDNREIRYASTVFPEPTAVARLSGGGDNLVITYAPVTPAATGLAGVRTEATGG